MKNYIYLFLLLSALGIESIMATDPSITNYAKLIDTKIGTEGHGLGCGFTFIGAAYPFGMMQITPAFFSPQKGIVINQMSGAGCPHMGNFPILPIAGELNSSPNNMEGYPRYETVNTSTAGYLAITMKDGTKCQTTVSKRSGIMKFIFSEKESKGTVIIGAGIGSTSLSNAQIKITSHYTCEGYAEGGEICGYSANYKIYFAAEFNSQAIAYGTWINSDLKKDRLQIGGKNSGAYFTFDTQNNSSIEYKIAISYVSIENAHENLRIDNNNRNFNTVYEDTETEWNKYLEKISIESSNTDRLKQFYTHFYHTLIHPNVFNDVNGEYMGADYNIHKTKENRDYYTTFSGWDTYRTQCQLLAILFPKESSDMVQSAIEFAEQSGGYGRWVIANIETGIMHGDPIPIIISNTYAFGGRNFDITTAYKHMKRGAMVVGTHSQNVVVRPGLENYLSKGIENASLCLEYTSSDYAIGQFALQALKNEKDADYFIKRAGNWKNLYDPSTRWLRSRHTHDMSWKNPDDDWREATKENYFWMVPFDLETLIDTIGGKNAASRRLDSLFVKLDAGYDDHYYAAGNEPDFQVPWIYNWTNEPYKTSEVVHRIFNEIYSSKPNGLPGNDDCGSMGAWYVFASIGLYPMIPGVAGFSISAPQFEKVMIQLPENELIIKGGDSKNIYIKELKLNGNKYSSSWIDWSKLSKGAELEFCLENKPNKKWGCIK